MTLPRDSRTSYSGMKVLRSTPMPLGGRSRTWPMDAFTTKPSPRYLLIVLALAGDSTMTRSLPLGFFLAVAMYFASLSVRPVRRFQGGWSLGFGGLLTETLHLAVSTAGYGGLNEKSARRQGLG